MSAEYACADELDEDDIRFYHQEEYVAPFDSDNHCFKCGESKDTVEEQYSFGVYAGRMCRECAINGYRDHCGLLDGEQGNPQDLDEYPDHYYEEEYYNPYEDLDWDY